MGSDVLKCRNEELFVVPELAKSAVAVHAQEGPDCPCQMVMVDTQALPCRARSKAYGALAVLVFEH